MLLLEAHEAHETHKKNSESPYFYGEMTKTDIFDRTFDFYRGCMLRHISLTLVFYLLSLFITGFVFYIGFNTIIPKISNLGYDLITSSITSIALIALLIYIIAVFFGLVLKALIAVIVKDTLAGKHSPLKSILFSVARILPRIFALSLAYVVVFIPATFILLIIFFMVSGFTNFSIVIYDVISLGKITSVNAPYLIGITAVFAILYILNIFLSNGVLAVVFEKRIFFGALLRSINLAFVKKCFFDNIFLQFLWDFFYILFIVISIFILGFIIKTPNVPVNVAIYSIIFFLIRLAVALILSVFLMPLKTILLAMIYIKQRSVTEGFDIELGLRKMMKKSSELGLPTYLNKRSAGLFSRFTAVSIDMIIQALFIAFICTITVFVMLENFDYSVVADSPLLFASIIAFAFFVVGVVYNSVCDTVFLGQTIGKRFFNIKVIDVHKKRLKFHQILLRNVIKCSLDIVLGVPFIFFNGKSIGDIASGTAVVIKNQRKTDYLPPLADISFISESDKDRLKLNDNEQLIIKQFFSRRSMFMNDGLQIYKLLQKYLCRKLNVPLESMTEQAILILLAINEDID